MARQLGIVERREQAFREPGALQDLGRLRVPGAQPLGVNVHVGGEDRLHGRSAAAHVPQLRFERQQIVGSFDKRPATHFDRRRALGIGIAIGRQLFAQAGDLLRVRFGQ